MSKSRNLKWGLIALGVVAAIPLFVLGLWAFMTITARPIHPKAAEVRSTVGAAPPAEWAAAVSQGQDAARAEITRQNLPGLSIAVGIDGNLVWAEGLGWADVENRVPVTPDVRFRMGTASKVFTSAAAGLLIEEGKLNLDAEIQTYVPAFPKKPWPVTVRQVMAHTAGIRKGEGDEEPLLHRRCKRPVDGIQEFAGADLLFEPGTRYHYSNYGWIVVSAAIESAANQPFAEFVRDRVLDPLALKDTRTEAAAEPVPAEALPYFPRFAADPRYGPQDPEQFDASCFSGSAAFITTPSDLVRFVTALGAGTLLKPATVQLLQTSQRLTSGQETGYGLGWDLETVDLLGTPTQVVGHDGEIMGGPVMSLMTFPDRHLTVAVMSNTSYADTPAIALKIAQIFAAQKKPASR